MEMGPGGSGFLKVQKPNPEKAEEDEDCQGAPRPGNWEVTGGLPLPNLAPAHVPVTTTHKVKATSPTDPGKTGKGEMERRAQGQQGAWSLIKLHSHTVWLNPKVNQKRKVGHNALGAN